MSPIRTSLYLHPCKRPTCSTFKTAASQDAVVLDESNKSHIKQKHKQIVLITRENSKSAFGLMNSTMSGLQKSFSRLPCFSHPMMTLSFHELFSETLKNSLVTTLKIFLQRSLMVCFRTKLYLSNKSKILINQKITLCVISNYV